MIDFREVVLISMAFAVGSFAFQFFWPGGMDWAAAADSAWNAAGGVVAVWIFQRIRGERKYV